MVRRCALWLLPDAADTAALRAVVDGVAQRLARSPFPSHLTVCGGLEISPPWLARELDLLVPELEPLELAVDGVEAAPSTFRALVLVLRPTDELLRIRHRLARLLPAPPRLPTPHLSLTYGAVPMATAEVLRDLSLPVSVRFDAVGLAAPGVAGWEDVQGWRLLHRAQLGRG